jgi:hypothetical protein
MPSPSARASGVIKTSSSVSQVRRRVGIVDELTGWQDDAKRG